MNDSFEHSRQQQQLEQQSVQQLNDNCNGDHNTNEQNSEPQLEDTSDHYIEHQATPEEKLQEACTRELDLLSQVEELEIEIKLKNVNAQLTRSKQLQKTLQELKEAYEKIRQMQKKQRALHEQINVLKAILKIPNEKHPHETISLNVSTSQAYTSTNECQIVKLTAERDEARELLKEEKHDLEQRLNDLFNLNVQNTALNDQLAAEKEKNEKYVAEITLVEQEIVRIQSELVTLQKDNQTISGEKNKLSDEMIEIKSKLEQRDDEVKKMGDELKAKAVLLADMNHKENQIRKIAKKYKSSFFDLENKYKALTAEKLVKQASSQIEHPLKDMTRAYDLQVNKRKFHPDEIGLLPKQQIFHEKLECALCGFSNFVRQNLVRHFENGCNGQQAQSDPVIDTDNLAASSNVNSIAENGATAVAATAATTTVTSEQTLGKFVPEADRNRCFARSCDYRTFSPYMLQQHIETSHKSENAFSCPHCRENLSANSTAKEILNHLRYHGSRIYKCPNCAFIHYLKPQIDKHIGEMHPNVRDGTITLDRPIIKDEPAKATSSTAAWFSSYKCNECSAFFSGHELIKSHINAAHRFTHQFECVVCQYSHDTKSNVVKHLHTTHGESDLSKIKTNYERMLLMTA